MTHGPHSTLGSTDVPLSQAHDLVMLDLDGVVYVGPHAVPGASEALAQARAAGARLAYITNNASRTADDVAAHLLDLGMPLDGPADVVTSAQAVARLVAEAVPAGSAVLLVGGDGLRLPLEQHGLRCVTSLDHHPVAVVQGYHPDLGWRALAEAAYAVQSGLPWFASNTDLTIPTARGVAPGNGSLVQAVANATGTRPVVAGKPEPALFRETFARVGGDRPLMVGDRFDTDIDGAIGVDVPSLVVLTGVNTLDELAALPAGRRPTYVAADVAGLNERHPEVALDERVARCAGVGVVLADGVVRPVGPAVPGTPALRASVALAWQTLDRTGVPVVVDGTLVP